jgi:hypothetical protein
MRKVVLATTALVVLAAAGAGGYYGFWYMKAQEVQKGFDQLIADAKTKNIDITYQSSEVKGFPTHFKLHIQQPSIALPIGEFLAEIEEKQRASNPMMPPSGSDLEKLRQWKERITFSDMMVGSDVQLKNYQIVYGLEAKGETLINNEVKQQYTATSTAAPSCNLVVDPGYLGNLNDPAVTPEERAKRVFAAFQSFDCNMPGSTMKNATNGEVIYEKGPAELVLNKKVDGDPMNPATGELRFGIKAADMKYTAAADKFIQGYYQLAGIPNYSAVLPSRMGTQQMDIQFTYKGPLNEQGFASGQPFSATLDRFMYESDLYKTDMNFAMNFGKDASQNTDFALKLDGTTTVGTEYITAMRNEIYQNMLPLVSMVEMQKSMQEGAAEGENTPPAAGQVDEAAKKNALALANALTPRMDTLGEIKQAMDVTYNGPADPRAAMGKPVSLKISTINFDAKPYGLALNGEVTSDGSSPFPKGNAELVCRQCDALMNDLLGYIRRVMLAMQPYAGVVQGAAPVNVSNVLTPEQIGAIKRFVTMLADKERTTNEKLVITVSHDGTGNLLISGEPLQKAMLLYQAEIVPAFRPAESIPYVPAR